jgi:hypothetical protein
MRNSLKTLLVASLLTAGACGGGSEGKNLERFAGIWTATAGTAILNCGGQSTPSPISSTVTWSLGTTSDLVQTTSSNSSCVIHADVDGDTATGIENQPCTVQGTDPTYGDLLIQATTITAYTFALAADGKTATENASGTLVQTDNTTGTTTSCTISETGGSYQKQ